MYKILSKIGVELIFGLLFFGIIIALTILLLISAAIPIASFEFSISYFWWFAVPLSCQFIMQKPAYGLFAAATLLQDAWISNYLGVGLVSYGLIFGFSNKVILWAKNRPFAIKYGVAIIQIILLCLCYNLVMLFAGQKIMGYHLTMQIINLIILLPVIYFIIYRCYVAKLVLSQKVWV